MSERDPDDLFDALRRGLADYGQHPPPPLWGRIQAQIQPPAVQPQLRRRSRHFVWLLSLLLILVSGLSWHYWRAQDSILAEHDRLARAHKAQVTREPSVLARRSAGRSQQGTTGTTNDPAYPLGPATPSSPRAKLGRGHEVSSALASSATGQGTSAGPQMPALGKREKAVAARQARPAMAAASTTWRTRQAPPLTLAGTLAARSTARLPRKAAESYRLPDPRANPAGKTKRSSESARPGDATAPELGTTRTPSVLVTTAVQSSNPATSSSPDMLGNAAALGGQLEPADLASEQHTAFPGPGTAAPGLLALRPVALSAVDFSLPDVHPRSDTSAARQVMPRPRRWSIQALTGPALSYRRLGNEGFNFWGRNDLLPPFPSGSVPGAAAANRRAEYEKPGIGFSLQLQAQRVLTGRWSLSAGVGYQEYAVESTYPTVAPVVSGPGPQPRTYTDRDTYRFVSMPVRVSYTLGYVDHLRYGLLAGPDLALYLGGSSAGTASAPQVWKTSGSTYRPLHVALSTGLDLRYQLGSHLEVMVQPTVSTFLTSQTRPDSGLMPRYLQGMGILMGLSYGLPAR